MEPAAAPGIGLEVLVRFSGNAVENVRLGGRNLRFVAICIGLGIMPWSGNCPTASPSLGTRLHVPYSW
jgi:hypothetical protein